jgi:mannose-6-phosphate isomerase-like protein (cupin superfamily)
VSPVRRGGLVLLLAVLVPAAGAASPGLRAVTPETRAWESFGLADRIPVHGDVTDPLCPSVTLVRLRPGTRLPPHAAPVDRAYLVLSGTLRVGVGKSWDESRMKALPAGSFWLVPARTQTFEWAEDEVVCEVTASPPATDCPGLEDPVFVTPDRVDWKPSGGMERAVLAGSPDRPYCPWVERLRLPAGASVDGGGSAPAGVTAWAVLSGSLRTGKEEGGGPARKELPAGTVVAVPAGQAGDFTAGTASVAQREFLGTVSRPCAWRDARRRQP